LPSFLSAEDIEPELCPKDVAGVVPDRGNNVKILFTQSQEGKEIERNGLVVELLSQSECYQLP
jgi:hypothetical protein